MNVDEISNLKTLFKDTSKELQFAQIHQSRIDPTDFDLDEWKHIWVRHVVNYLSVRMLLKLIQEEEIVANRRWNAQKSQHITSVANCAVKDVSSSNEIGTRRQSDV